MANKALATRQKMMLRVQPVQQIQHHALAHDKRMAIDDSHR